MKTVFRKIADERPFGKITKDTIDDDNIRIIEVESDPLLVKTKDFVTVCKYQYSIWLGDDVNEPVEELWLYREMEDRHFGDWIHYIAKVEPDDEWCYLEELVNEIGGQS